MLTQATPYQRLSLSQENLVRSTVELIPFEGKKVAWTRPIFDTLEPEWNEKFCFKNVSPNTLCKLYLLDKDVGADDPLGETQFKAANTDGHETTFELPIKRGDKNAGSIIVKVKSHPIRAGRDSALQQYGPVHYSAHASFATGLITQSMTDDDKLQSTSYHVQLHNIQELMPSDFEWNKNYPTIQKIFSPDHPESPMLRKAVQSQHALVYMHDSQTVYGNLDSPNDFFKLAHEGRRLDKPVLFTYAITNTGWYFSETGAAFFKDMLSKHMLHCGAAFSVKYAGEFHIEKGHFGKYKLIIDNNSGTYAPPKAALPQLEALFENNFPGISVKALDRDDPDLKQAREEILAAWA
ncbi:hypothetical protein BBP00_00008440 [Phytophthora kernoviae]|uniref:C2 domain-containing protein n=1 Tax=Phytophthora kernoviae TaxID=325452 RepID=A0A3F2RFI2_9STRA|nr:hypothetical protein BBP00_00008440 [Phytophthora kernoviae]